MTSATAAEAMELIDLAALAGHRWQWRYEPRGLGRPLHLASCPCWSNGGTPPAEQRAAVRRPPSSLWARLFGTRAEDLDWNR